MLKNYEAVTLDQYLHLLQVLELLSNTNINSLDILQAVQFYAKKGERGFTQKDYEDLITQVRIFFPELEEITSDRTEQLIATLEYKENGRTLDILYSGTGLKRFLDVLIKVTLSKASIVLIDEPEFGMHPTLQRRFLDFLGTLAMQRDLQFFLVTHSPVFLNGSNDPPDPEVQSFVQSLITAGQSASLLAKREIEFNIPEEVYVSAQGGDPAKEAAVRQVMRGDQSQKLRNALGQAGCNIPRGSSLRSLLQKHLTKENLDSEIKTIVEKILVPWAKTLRGE